MTTAQNPTFEITHLGNNTLMEYQRLVEDMTENHGMIAREISLFVFVGSMCTSVTTIAPDEEHDVHRIINKHLSNYHIQIIQYGQNGYTLDWRR